MRFWASARDKMRARAQALLEPGEEIQQIFPAGVGHDLRIHEHHQHRIIAVTDRAIVVMDHRGVGYHPVKVLRRLPRATRLGPVSWRTNRCDALGEVLTIDSRWFDEVRAADAALGYPED